MDVYLICMPLSVKFTRRHIDAAMTGKLLIQLGKKNALVSALHCDIFILLSKEQSANVIKANAYLSLI